MTFLEWQQDGMIDALALAFGDGPTARLLLTTVGFPPARIPSAQANALVFWQLVCQQLELGIIPDGFSKVRNAALGEFPENPVFKRKKGEQRVTAHIEVFISYSHKDEAYRKRLDVSLAQMKRDGLISSWSDRQILPGDRWSEKIDEQLDKAALILALASPDFLASDYCNGIEMTRALERAQRHEARLIPIIVRPCDWMHSPLGGFQALPADGKPISTSASQDAAFQKVVEGLRRVIKAISEGSGR